MKLLQLAWDHPATTALLVLAAVAAVPAFVTHPVWASASALIAGLSIHKAFQRAAAEAAAWRAAMNKEHEVLLAGVQERRAESAPWTEAGRRALATLQNR
jgi:hypothetical protein